MAIRELRIDPSLLLELLKQTPMAPAALPLTTRITDVALDHGHTATHRDRPPVIVLQIESGEFSPEDAGRPLLPMSFKR
jgi:hypothetical protein